MNSYKAKVNSPQKMKTSSSIFLKQAKSFNNYPVECSCKCYKELITLQSSDQEAGFSSLPFEFCRESSLHGLRFIGNPRRHKFERVFWLIAFLISVSLAVYSITLIWDKYKQTPIITVFRPTEVTIDRIAFPAVTICNNNNVLKENVKRLTKELLNSGLNETSNYELYILDHVCESSMTFSERFNFSLEEGSLKQSVRDEILAAMSSTPSNSTVKNKEIVEVLRSVAQKCSEMILLCLWNDEVTECTDLFEGVETDYGYCCSFNMAPSDLLRSNRMQENSTYGGVPKSIPDWKNLNLDSNKMVLTEEEADKPNPDPHVRTGPKYPRRQFRPGKSSGLSVLLDPDMESYFCTNTDSAGFMALAHLPLTFPSVSDRATAVKPNSEVFMKIKPEITMADPDIKNFGLEKRNCYFGQEYPLVHYKYYTSSNCEDECIASLTYKQCQCVRYYMPRNSSQELCGPSKFNCTELVRKQILQEGFRLKCKDCLPTCVEIEYETSISYSPLRQDVSLWKYPNGTDAPWTHKNVSILHVHFDVDSTYPKLRQELYGFLDLLSSTGGLLGLCLGFSALSLLEIIYYLTIRVCCTSKKGQELGQTFINATDSAWKKAKTILAGKTFLNRLQSKSDSPVYNIPFERSSTFSNFYEGRITKRNRDAKDSSVIASDHLGNMQVNPVQYLFPKNTTRGAYEDTNSDKSMLIRW